MTIDKKLAIQFADYMMKSLFAQGTLSKTDLALPEKELKEKFLKIIKKSKIGMMVDHRSDILSQAEIFYGNNNIDYSKVFYAMFFEHSLNGIIENECKKRKISQDVQGEIIKGINIKGKLTWLPILLEHKKFNNTHLKTIIKLSEERNAFIHYKWKMEFDDSNESNKEIEIETEFKKIKLAVKYMKLYESLILFKKQKKILSRKFKLK